MVNVLVLLVTVVSDVSVVTVGQLSVVWGAELIVQWVTYGLWSLFFLMSSGALIGLWTFSKYLEFDARSTEFGMKFVGFFFVVWALLMVKSLILVLVYWEMVGLVSFGLMCHWYEREAALRGAILALTFNRWGDMCLVFVIAECAQLSYGEIELLTTDVFFLLLCVGFLKSVVVISFLWLPDAMEGPTPVSSLLHSATLVMAGLYLMLRTQSSTNAVSLTIFFALACVVVCFVSSDDVDLKRVVASSTVAMTSLLWLLLELDMSDALIGMSLLHASYKSMLFMLLGKFIADSGTQDTLVGTSVMRGFVAFMPIWLSLAPTSSVYSTIKHSACVLDSSFLEMAVSQVMMWLLALMWIPAFRCCFSPATSLNVGQLSSLCMVGMFTGVFGILLIVPQPDVLDSFPVSSLALLSIFLLITSSNMKLHVLSLGPGCWSIDHEHQFVWAYLWLLRLVVGFFRNLVLLSGTELSLSLLGWTLLLVSL